MVSQNEISALERAELQAFNAFYSAASSEVVDACGLSVTAVDDAIVFAVNRFDVLAMNRAMGVGLNRPLSDAFLDNLHDALLRCGSPRFFVPVAPVDRHADVAASLIRRGLRHHNNWIRLSRSVTDIPAPPANPDVQRIDRTSASVFGRLVSTAFGFPPAVAPLVGQTVGRAGWSHYLAYDGETPIGAAAMYVAGDAAWFGFAATDAAHRKRGAQRALVIRRLMDAAAAGCSRISVETAEDGVVKDAPSFRNLRRLGFEIAYARPNYLWTRPSS